MSAQAFEVFQAVRCVCGFALTGDGSSLKWITCHNQHCERYGLKFAPPKIALEIYDSSRDVSTKR